jgi:hypothetical protein
MQTVKFKKRKLNHGNFFKLHTKENSKTKKHEIDTTKITVENFYWVKK